MSDITLVEECVIPYEVYFWDKNPMPSPENNVYKYSIFYQFMRSNNETTKVGYVVGRMVNLVFCSSFTLLDPVDV